MSNYIPKMVNVSMQAGGAGNRYGDKWVDMKSYKCISTSSYFIL